MKKFLEILQDIRFYFVVVSLTSLVLMVKYNNLKLNHLETLEENLESKGVIDSLSSEIFVKDLQIGSYEIMWGILEEINKPLADSINNQVE